MNILRRICVERGPDGLSLSVRSGAPPRLINLAKFHLALMIIFIGIYIHVIVTDGSLRYKDAWVSSSAGIVFGLLCLTAFAACVGGALLWTYVRSERVRVSDGQLRYELRGGRWTLRRRELPLSRIAHIDYAVPSPEGAVVRIFLKDGSKPWTFASGSLSLEALTAVQELRALLPRDS